MMSRMTDEEISKVSSKGERRLRYSRQMLLESSGCLRLREKNFFKLGFRQ